MRLRLPTWILIGLCATTLLLLAMPFAAARLAAGRLPPLPSGYLAQQPVYTATAGIDGEIFPAFANYASLQRPEQRQLATVKVTITNTSSKSLRNRIMVEVPGWSYEELQPVEVAPGASREFKFG